MLAHKTTDSTPPSEKVSSGVPESTVEAVFSPKTQDNGFLQTTHSPSVTLMPGFFGPSQHGANFGSPWSIDPSQPSPFQDQFEMDITTAEPTQPQTTQDWSSMNLTIDPRQLQLVYDGMPVNFAQPQTTQDWLSMSSTIDHMQPQLTQDWLSMNPTIDPMHLIQDQIPMDSATRTMHPQSTWDQSLMNPIIDPMQLQLIQNQMLMDFAAQEMQPQSTRNQPPMNPPIDPAQFQVIQDQIPMDSAAEPTQPQLTRDQSPMNLTRKPECDQQLEQHKGLIRSEYLDHDLSVLAVLDKLKSQNITITKNRLEVQLKRWGFFKQIKKATWRYLDHNIRKRKNQNKESEVIFRGKRLKQENITRGTEDNHKPDTLTLIAQRLSSPPPPTQPYVHLGTPPPLPMEFEWPSSLPWQKFQNESQISAGEFAQFDGARGILTTVLAQTKNHAFAQLQGLNSHSSISRLAANIGMVMPDGNREDLLYTIQDMQYNCTTGSVFHCLKIIIYHLSNNLLEFDTYEEWSLFVNGLINIGILGPRMNLRDLRDKYATIKAFMEKLFQQAIRWICEETETQEQNLALIKWLISSGQDPNPAFWIPGADAPTTPLQEAAAIGFHELVKLLLAYGATDEYAGDYNTPAAVLVVYPTVSDDIKLRIVDAIFEGGSLASWETVLHKAIQQGNMNLVKRILGRGPDVTKAFTGNIPPVFKMNALSFAVMAGKDFVEVILDHARAQGNLNAHLITPDVFIAAAVTGDAETIRHLHQIHPTGSCENQLRITPLRAAVSAGQQSTCEVLLELYGGLSPVLLFLAAYNGHENLLRFLLEKGIDVNAAIDWDNCGECARVSKLHVHRSKAGQFPTVLCILKSVSTARSPSCSNCIAMLIEGGAWLVGGEVYLFAKQLLTRPLQVALALGGSPDEQGPSGKSALQAALTGNYESHGLKFDSRRSKIAQVLLKSGAKLSGGEVVWAIRHLDVELLTLLASSIQSFQDTDGSGTSALEAAICSRDPNVLKQVLPSYTGHYDPGSLCAAVREQHRNLIDSLLTNRPRLAAYDVLEGTAVGLAAMFGDVNLLQKLLNRFHAVWKPNSAFLPPLEDRKRHNPPFWRRYASASPELCKTSPLSFAAFCTDPQGFSILLDRGCRADLFTWTVIADKGNFPCLELLIEHGQRLGGMFLSAPVKKPPLCIAIERKNSQMVQSLLEAGANVNLYHYTLERGRSPLQLAVELGDLDLVSSLMKEAADINAPPSFDGGATALQLAVMKGYIGLARLLLDNGASVNARGAKWNGRTALEGAAEHGRLDMLELLIDHGALDPGIGRCQFIRAVKLATIEGHHTAAELLRQSCEWTEEDEYLFVNEDCLGLEEDDEVCCCCDDIGCIYNSSESEDAESEGGYTESEDTCWTGSDMED